MKINNLTGTVVRELCGFTRGEAFAQLEDEGIDTSDLTVSYSINEIRALREPLMAHADILVNKAEDLGTASKITSARNYRKALRDITNGVTDYATITWPTPPVV